jgi:hypothetical protein
MRMALETWKEGGQEGRVGRCRSTARAQDKKASALPDDRELARSSPAFMVINWIVRTER